MLKLFGFLCLCASFCMIVPEQIDAQRGNRGRGGNRGGGRGGSVFGKFKDAKPKIAQVAPFLRAKDAQGKELNLRDYLGQWVVIEFGSYT